MLQQWLLSVLLGSFVLAFSGCIPVPVSTVPLHPREERPFLLESALAENYGIFSCPAYDPGGEFLAVYDSGTDLVRILRSADLSTVNSLKPTRWPRRLSFSPAGHFLLIETHQGWLDDSLRRKPATSGQVSIDSPEAVKDNIQRVEVWDLQTGQTTSGLSCDAVVTSEPVGGWLWARNWAITPGYRSSALLEAHFSADEKELSVLCWDGVEQRWDSSTWERLENIPAPPFWDAVMGLSTARWLAENDVSSETADGRIVLLRVREKSFGFASLYLWDRSTAQSLPLPGECASRLQPVYALSRDGKTVVAACNKDLGYAVRVWDFASGQERPLKDAEFGFAGGIPTIRGEGVALSPDGRYLAVALLGQMEALLANVLLVPATLSRSDLRLWDLETGRELITLPIDELDGGTNYFKGVDLAFSPDGQTLAVAGRRLRIYQLVDLSTSSP